LHGSIQVFENDFWYNADNNHTCKCHIFMHAQCKLSQLEHVLDLDSYKEIINYSGSYANAPD
jgi:hypothetical protein